ncbi:hypothetical protein CHUAL_003100 [Chamberlinius hualienensis]
MLWFSVICIVWVIAGHSLANQVTDDEVDRILVETEELYARMAEPVSTRSAETHHRMYKKSVNPFALHHGQQAAIFSHAVRTLAKKHALSMNEAEKMMIKRSTTRPNSDLNVICSRSITCNANSVYRTFDGSCNNLVNKDWGIAITPFDRILSPVYGDGVNSLRQNFQPNQPLLSPRIISNIMHPDFNIPHSTATHMTVFFGQFLDHDFTSTPEFQNFQCCNNPTFAQCMPIQVPTNDEWYSRFGITCLDVGRSIPACGTGVREQINQNSAFIDGSQIYGQSSSEQASIIANNGSLLTDTNPRLLPKDFQATNCGTPSSNIVCFKAGDDRVNEQPGLTSMQTLWMREHNRIAVNLRSNNPTWTADTIFQESRRIVVAELQNIVYNEYLPSVLGQATMTNFGLTLPSNPATFTNYDPNIKAGIFNSFATAAFRFGHTLIQNEFSLGSSGSFLLETSFQNPQIIYQSVANIDRMLMGATQQPAQSYDNFISQAVTRHLFQRPNVPFGNDLASLNIQRGRDHGLPPWTAFRSACGLPVPQNFDQIIPLGIVSNTSTVNRMRDAYA